MLDVRIPAFAAACDLKRFRIQNLLVKANKPAPKPWARHKPDPEDQHQEKPGLLSIHDGTIEKPVAPCGSSAALRHFYPRLVALQTSKLDWLDRYLSYDSDSLSRALLLSTLYRIALSSLITLR